ncbi:serine/threonine-protein kinase CTR1-like [Zingiber officinale]|uniref:serine/threonine-protein kinase CTR1-like n=1 Tax=Zingiber officinale TaxID=94328 RepID=UPI001C4C0ED0|nr:serine/threonine-protein kinase CTR1-like [Zingiber officinale]XP_042457634.1 serine/threonine-protein kinase CTR1-like [Zingiber officinale]
MEMPGRRSSYSLLGQNPDEALPPLFDTPPSDKARAARFEWPINASSVAAPPPLQRQSSGSSYGGSSFSGDYYLPATISSSNVDSEGFNPLAGGEGRGQDGAAAGLSSSSAKSWAQQAEETYQLQLALALRLCSEAACAEDPNFLDAADQMVLPERAAPTSLSHRFWVNGCLSYHDKIPDGFYLIQGMDPFVWTLCTDVEEENRIPSIESLKTVHPNDSSIEVVLIDRQHDPDLRHLETIVTGLSCSCATAKDVVEQLAKLVCTRMGGIAFNGEDALLHCWKECGETIKASSCSIVLPMGKLSFGLCRHRALLFKMLADTINLPCRVAKGCKYCKTDDASSCLVRFGLEREYLVDLIKNPGNLCEPDSLLNGPYSVSIASPLRPPKVKSSEINVNFRTLAKQYFQDCQSLNLIFKDASAGTSIAEGDAIDPSSSKPSDGGTESLQPCIQKVTWPDGNIVNANKMFNPLRNARNPDLVERELGPMKLTAQDGCGNTAPCEPNADMKDFKLTEDSKHIGNRPSNDIRLAEDDLNIPWRELILKERIGAGSFGTVHRAEWHGSEVAVKILMEQDFHPGRLREFLREVAIMKSLRHPNIVLFMGAVTEPPNLSIVTEYLSRGSLYRLLHKNGAKETIEERRRLSMAFDVAKGMNYLHKRNPPIVHRDLKSPNLLVDKKYTVKVCDFGLSRLKANTFLSSKSLAGTPEWMAPEVLRDEPSNEKSDIYSFGVILWELMTLQQPWSNLNPAQVVAAVGFKARRPEIPSTVNRHVAAIIESCWASEPWKRPSFSSIMESLKPLIKTQSPQPLHSDMSSIQ